MGGLTGLVEVAEDEIVHPVGLRENSDSGVSSVEPWHDGSYETYMVLDALAEVGSRRLKVRVGSGQHEVRVS